jgi:hypothetical protein
MAEEKRKMAYASKIAEYAVGCASSILLDILTDPDIAKFAYNAFSNKQMKYGIQIVVNRGQLIDGVYGSSFKIGHFFSALDHGLIDSAKFVSEKMDMQILLTSIVYDSLSTTVSII